MHYAFFKEPVSDWGHPSPKHEFIEFKTNHLIILDQKTIYRLRLFIVATWRVRVVCCTFIGYAPVPFSRQISDKERPHCSRFLASRYGDRDDSPTRTKELYRKNLKKSSKKLPKELLYLTHKG